MASAAGPQWYGVCGKNGTSRNSVRGARPAGGAAASAALCGGSANTAQPLRGRRGRAEQPGPPLQAGSGRGGPRARGQRIVRVNGNTFVKPRMSVISRTTKIVRMTPEHIATGGCLIDLRGHLGGFGVGECSNACTRRVDADAARLQAGHDIGT